jgi:two-component system CheB/CheR fusion protein
VAVEKHVPNALAVPEPDPDFEALLEYLKTARGFDFTGYKRASLMRRVDKRVHVAGAASYAEYQDYLEVHPEEFNELFNTILINVTSFFRDRPSWEYLQQDVLPAVFAGADPASPIRVWVAGCSSGQEAYTAAMVIAEVLGADQFERRVKIYATDVDDDALGEARAGVYTAKAVESVPDDMREKYFERADSRFAFRRDLRRAVIFGRNDLVQDAPISRVDLLVCRNTLMYFNADTQGHILRHFNFALRPSGVLFLGKSEMLITHAGLFQPVSMRWRIFSKVPRAVLRERLLEVAGPVVGGGVDGDGAVSLPAAAVEALPVAQLVVTRDGVVASANQHARRLLEVPATAVGRVLSDLDVATRPVDIRDAVRKAVSERRSVTLGTAEWTRAAGGETRRFDVEVTPVTHENEILGASVTFIDVTRFASLQGELEQSQRELETAYEELQSTVEELETTNEELQSTNEELETTNEELQSTNEELETMNEELQSTNEELEAMNDEFGQRTGELNEANSVLEAILTTLGVGVAVVDRDLAVRIWNYRCEDMWGLRHDEVEGVDFAELDIGLPVEELRGLLRATINDLRQEEIVVDATNRRGRPIRCGVKSMPLVVAGKEIRGAILIMDELDRPNDA